jgi:hypothetical protein
MRACACVYVCTLCVCVCVCVCVYACASVCDVYVSVTHCERVCVCVRIHGSQSYLTHIHTYISKAPLELGVEKFELSEQLSYLLSRLTCTYVWVVICREFFVVVYRKCFF